MRKKLSLIIGGVAMLAATPVLAYVPKGDEPVAVPRAIKQGVDLVYVDPDMNNVARRHQRPQNWLQRILSFDFSGGRRGARARDQVHDHGRAERHGAGGHADIRREELGAHAVYTIVRAAGGARLLQIAFCCEAERAERRAHADGGHAERAHHHGLEPSQLRTVAEQASFCMAATPAIGLSPARSQLAEAIVAAYGDNPQLLAALDALEFIKLAKSPETTTTGDPPFTFGEGQSARLPPLVSWLTRDAAASSSKLHLY
jgi:hypothetical protein